MITIETMKKALETLCDSDERRKWDRGVNAYACNILRNVIDFHGADPLQTQAEFERAAMNGAKTWKEYSSSGRALVSNYHIAIRLYTPSELKKKRGGELNPNNCETWLDVQARALDLAAVRAWKAVCAAAEC